MNRIRMRRIATAAHAAVFVLALAATAQASVIFQDGFSRGTAGTPVTVNGTAPDVRPGTQTWTSTIDTAANGDLAAMINAARAAYLPWSPASGHLYELSVKVRLTSTAGGIATLGFFDNNIATNRAPNGSPAVQTPWLGLRNTGGALFRDVGAFVDQTTAAGTTKIKISDAPLVWNWNTLKIVLDTTAANWTVAAYVTDTNQVFVQVGATQTYVGDGGLATAVTRVGYSTIAGAVIHYDDFKLESMPFNPGTVVLIR
jgi:hypothetical protein